MRHEVSGRDARRNAVKVAQHGSERHIRLLRANPGACIEPLSCVVELGKVIVPAVDEVAHFFQRKPRGLRAIQHVPVGEPLGQH